MKKFIFVLLFFACCATIPRKAICQADSLSIKSGDSQFGITEETLPDSFVVSVFDINSNLVSGVTVSFEVDKSPPNASEKLSASSDVTDVNGEAGVLFTLGNKLGMYTVFAFVGFDTVIFSSDAITLKETRKSIFVGMQELLDENIGFNATRESGIFKTVVSKRQNKKVKIGRVPNQSEKNELESLIDDNLDAIIAKALRAKGLVP